jgi:hypothetical protein
LQQRIESVSGGGSSSRELRGSLEVAVAAENRERLWRWQFQQRIERVSGGGSCSRELRQSLEAAVGRIIEKQWQGRN